MDWTTISYIIAMIGCAIGISGWLSRGKSDISSSTEKDVAFRTRMETYMEMQTKSMGNMERTMSDIKKDFSSMDKRLTKAEMKIEEHDRHLRELEDLAFKN